MTNLPRLAAALDGFVLFPALKETVAQLQGLPVMFKIRPDLIYRFGAEKLAAIGLRGDRIFLDAKLHDIGASSFNDLNTLYYLFKPRLVTCHTSGSDAMLKTLVSYAADTLSPHCNMVGVTVLTDIGAIECRGTFGRETEAQVLMLAAKGWNQGIRHFVSSPQEVAAVKRQHPQAFCITPGVRPAGTSMDDQKRVDTPTAAILNGADMLVVGRPITQADDPAAATVAILAEINAALASREQAQASA
ncbi:MAG: orotidine-5'-phosphate decarboxylase [Proteobacteria bacterium]|nr:orotidine-5'-phosphate decarboxylase [Pseudomonadota bacterium]